MSLLSCILQFNFDIVSGLLNFSVITVHGHGLVSTVKVSKMLNFGSVCRLSHMVAVTVQVVVTLEEGIVAVIITEMSLKCEVELMGPTHGMNLDK
ncbi:unnamed protein product [Rhodiola kirilowii]